MLNVYNEYKNIRNINLRSEYNAIPLGSFIYTVRSALGYSKYKKNVCFTKSALRPKKSCVCLYEKYRL